jgi:hypothetical protein
MRPYDEGGVEVVERMEEDGEPESGSGVTSHETPMYETGSYEKPALVKLGPLAELTQATLSPNGVTQEPNPDGSTTFTF